MELVYNKETEKWEARKEPFITIEIETEEDFNFIQSAIDHYKKCNGQEWISVKDRLPEVEKRVLVLAWAGWDTDKKYPKIVCGMYEDGTIWSEDSDWNWETDYLCEYDEDQDDWKIPEGWFEYCLYNEDNLNYAIDNFVTHWMPLPESPKEE